MLSSRSQPLSQPPRGSIHKNLVSLLQLAVIAVGLLIYLPNVVIGVPFVFSPTLLPVVLSTLALAVVAVSLLVATKTEDVKTAQSVVPSADSHICDVVQSLEAAVAKGLASYYGLSNVSGKQLEVALTCARRIEPAVVENHYSLMYRRDEIDVLPLVQKLGLLYLAYSPLERGLLSLDPYLASVGARYGKSAAQVALNWLISVPNVVPNSPRPAARGGKCRSLRVAPQSSRLGGDKQAVHPPPPRVNILKAAGG